jgi:hypothetical protein
MSSHFNYTFVIRITGCAELFVRVYRVLNVWEISGSENHSIGTTCCD